MVQFAPLSASYSEKRCMPGQLRATKTKIPLAKPAEMCIMM